MKHKLAFLLLFCVCLILGTGCKKLDEEGRKNISGTITLDGVALEGGTIKFAPLDTQAPDGAGVTGGTAVIQDGKYELTRDMGLYAGTYKVRIEHIVIIDPKTGEPLEDMSRFKDNPDAFKADHRVPEKYNKKTELTLTVGEGKSQTHDFTLTK